MKAFLMYRDEDFDLKVNLPPNAAELTQDLEIDTLLAAMACGDTFLFEVVKKAIFSSLGEPEAILYRQQILEDCLKQSDTVRELYAIAVEAIEREKKVWRTMTGRYPEGLLSRSIEVLQLFMALLKRLRHVADEHGAKFHSEGFIRLFDMLATELDDEYLGIIEDHLECLAFRSGVLMSAELGKGNKGINFVLRKPRKPEQGWKERLQSWTEWLSSKDRISYFYQIDDRDESGFKALAELRGQGIGQVASALAQSTDHILSFFRMLQLELGFYVACLNLRDQLASKGEPICFPQLLAAGTVMFSARGLYDVSLSLSMADRAVGNDVNGDEKMLVMITGANRGGKSTFLRSIGLAQLMMQCGMFLPAESFHANVCDAIYTHFKREEDTTMRSGKLDEELSRMSSIVDKVTPNSIILLNESFASTNEREGSEIARQIVRALLETGIKVFYVTHMFDLAQGFYQAKMDGVLFLRAERLADGRRTFRLGEAQPLPTSYGQDLYRRIFGAA
jgi:DNA mismatch repair ATPase MutS